MLRGEVGGVELLERVGRGCESKVISSYVCFLYMYGRGARETCGGELLAYRSTFRETACGSLTRSTVDG